MKSRGKLSTASLWRNGLEELQKKHAHKNSIAHHESQASFVHGLLRKTAIVFAFKSNGFFILFMV
jgi:hypothetical protein